MWGERCGPQWDVSIGVDEDYGKMELTMFESML